MNKRTVQYLQYAVNEKKVRFRKTPTQALERPAARPTDTGHGFAASPPQ